MSAELVLKYKLLGDNRIVFISMETAAIHGNFSMTTPLFRFLNTRGSSVLPGTKRREVHCASDAAELLPKDNCLASQWFVVEDFGSEQTTAIF